MGKTGLSHTPDIEKSHLSKYSMVSLKKLDYIEKEDTM